ncbi:hypothetical protein KC19_7G103900 [Ceratodon purpureus]|uniref:Protein kinase domain-containing protein n=1 Tax=Ceratodon purpureus TaxID=3225 RepID=A0A8T0H9J8_CERPU|nr:hypothetical protein KC19_7G103900 [Ceratodon purpureus]
MAMDEGAWSGSQAIKNTGNHHGKRVAHGAFWGNEASTESLTKKMRLHKLSDAVHLNAAHCKFKKCIDIALDTCNEVHELIRTWRENHWHLPGRCLRLNKKKCEDLQQYLERTKTSYTSSTCETAAGEYLTAVKRAKNLVEESSHNDWLLKAVELWECSEHFVEVFLDLCWSSHIMSVAVKNSKEQEWMAKEQEWLLNSRRCIAQANSQKTETCDDKEKLGAMVRATLLDGALKKGSAEHQLALLLEDRLNDQSSWHPPILTSFNFCIRSRFRLLSRGASKTGASGVVLTFPWVYEKPFAVKMRHRNTSNVLRTFKNEFEVLDKYRSPYIVRVVGYWELESWLDMRPWAHSATLCPFLFMEAMEFDLEGLIHRCRELQGGSDVEEGFSALEAIKLMLPVAKALRFLHDKDVAHRDVKLQNIMCSNATGDFDDAIVKLIDFGEAVEGVSRIPCDMNRPAGTKGYMDPEMWKVDSGTGTRSGYNLFRADVFSFAMVFVELLTWRSPWGKMGREVQEKLNNGERPPLPDDLPDCVRFIVECCWCADATARPTFTDICCMLQNAKLLLLDENFFGERADLFCYLDGDCIDRNIFDTDFLQ